MLLQYRYDGSFEGLLSAFAEALSRCETPGEFCAPTDAAEGFLFESRSVPQRPEQAAALLRSLRRRAGSGVVTTLTHAFLAEDPRIPAALFDYVRITLDRGASVDGWQAHPEVRRVTAACRHVQREVHRFRGLLRFRELADGTLYAPYEPDHCITLPLSCHFRGRMAGNVWVIHDRRRQVAVHCDGNRLRPVLIEPDGDPARSLSHGERAIQDLWRRYHHEAAISSRNNPALQRSFMPRKYWRYLTEMQAGDA
ncbi:MAG: TIGR03915 family putative DNA repair protein [Lentisphaeria bacterium]|nr:TIGR03915 family putative DNA repair protein [Lentisphaeria bacterium]